MPYSALKGLIYMRNIPNSIWIFHPLESLINYLMPEEEIDESDECGVGFDLVPPQTLRGYEEFVKEHPEAVDAEAHRMTRRRD